MASSRAAFLLALFVSAALLSSCYASSSTGDEARRKMRVEPMSDPKCEVMLPCQEPQCTKYCVEIGLGKEPGFCSFHGMQFYCCCPVPDTP